MNGLKKYICIVCYVVSFNVIAQREYFEQLEQNLRITTNDSIYVKSLYYLSWSEMHKSKAEAVGFANALYDYAKSTHNTEALSLAFDCKAQLSLKDENYKQASLYVDSIYYLNREKEPQEAKATYHHALGHLFDYQLRHDSAIYHWDIALKHYQELGMIKYSTAMQVNIGSSLYLTSYKEKELSQLTSDKANLWTRLDSLSYVEELNKLGRVFLDLANFTKAEDYISLGYDWASQLGNYELQAVLLLNLGEINFFQGDFQKAIHYYGLSLELKKQMGLAYGYSAFKMGRAYLEIKHYGNALFYLNDAVQYLEEEGDEYALVDAYGFLSDLHYELGDTQKALEAVVNLEELYARIEEGERLSDFHKKIVETSFLTHPKQAKEYFTFLREQETVAQMYEVESAFQLEKKETEILLLNQENEIARKNRYVLVLIVVLVLLILLIILQRNRTLAKSKRIVELENKYKNVELQQSKLLLSKKKDDFSDLVNNLNDLKGDLSTQKFNQLVGSLKTAKVVEKNWEDYISSFEKLNPYFFEQLKQRAINLTASEKRLCALIHQGMTISGIAHVLNLQKKSVESARYRLRKKFQLHAQDNLQEFIKTLCKANK